MTIKEMDYKLAKDIARLRISVNNINNIKNLSATTEIKTDPAAGTTGDNKISVGIIPLSMEIVEVMKQLNANKNQELLDEIQAIVDDPDLINVLKKVISKRYIQSMQEKLKLRQKAHEASKPMTKFTSSDYERALKTGQTEIDKAADIIVKTTSTDIIINAAAAEACGYNMHLMANAIRQRIQNECSDISTIVLSPIIFADAASKMFERLEKQTYYGKWIYERFMPIGIIKIKLE